jgi:hypothetical protein
MKKRAPKTQERILDELEVPERFREVVPVPEVKRGKSHIETMDNLGIDGLCLLIKAGKAVWKISEEISVPAGTIYDWLGKDPERSARARQARTETAEIWDELAEKTLIEAGADLDFQKARELAHHYRWRASKIAPQYYGDKKEVNVSGQVTFTSLIADSFKSDG